MNHPFLVTVADSRQNLTKLRTGLFLLHSTVGDQVVVQFATRRIFHDEEEGVLGFNDFIELHNMRMIQHLHNPHFSMQL